MSVKKWVILLVIIPTIAILSSCSKTAENEHLPEYCRSYSDFIEFASRDMYELVEGGINRYDYFNVISEIELDLVADDPSVLKDLDGIQCFQNLTTLTLTGPGFKDISQISALKNIQEIALVNTSVVSIDSFKNLSKVKSLTITDTKTLQSVRGVEEMTKLRNLELVGNGIVNIESLSSLINLESLNLSKNEMVEFPSITGLENLKTLNLSENNISRLGDDLSGLAHLIFLDLSDNEISDLSNFDDLSDLQYLDLSNNNIGRDGSTPDFSSFANARDLVEIYLNGNGMSDISGLGDTNIPNLQYLYLHENNIDDISFISEYDSLIDLTLYDNNLTNIDNISGMELLTEIDLSDNNIVSFGGLTNISGLKIINLRNNNISVIPDLSSDIPNLRYLDLSYNDLDDTSGLEGHTALEEVYLDNNGMDTLLGIKDIPFLTTLSLYNPVVVCEDEILEGEICENPKYPLNPNELSYIEDSFVNLASYTGLVGDFNEFNYDAFQFGDNVEIVRSFINVPFIDEIDWTNMDIDSIDSESIIFPQLQSLFLGNNNFDSIAFLHGNPSLVEVVLTGNQITDLDVLNGTETDDFDNLQAIIANNIFTSNDLEGAFVDLPELSQIQLGNTAITGINNSFNDLPQLTELIINSSNVTAINGSFNNLFTLVGESGGIDNAINFSGGNVTSIVNSFNGSYYDYINISNQSPLDSNTFITDSFNNTILTSNSNGLNLSSSDFKVVSGSFNDVEALNISLANSNVDLITTSLQNTTVTEYVRLYLNNLETVPDLATLSTPVLGLQSNRLTTVSFIHDMPDLVTLNIDNQLDELDNATLLTLDGINNLPSLTTLTVDGLELTAIDGLQDVGLTIFEYQADEHNDVQITSISATSFSNSLITQLNLGGNEVVDMAFLDNFDLLTELAISFTTADISFFEAQDFEGTLESLLIATNSAIEDFAPLQGYDTMDTLAIIAPFTNVYNNIDDLDSLNNLNIYFNTVVTEFNGCFNTMPAWTIQDDYIESTYENLLTVRDSFAIVDSDNYTIEGHITVENSFNNVTGLTIVSEGLEPASLIDADSFDSVTDLTMDATNYLTYANIANFDALETLTFENLNAPIGDLTSTTITDLVINSPGATANLFNFDLPVTANITITSPAVDIGVGLTGENLTVNSTFDVGVSPTNATLNIDGAMENLVITGTDVTSVDFTGLVVADSIGMDTENLDTITTTIGAFNNANTLTVNSNVLTADYDATVLTMNINNNTATSMTATAIDTINYVSDEAVLDVELNATTVNLLNVAITDLIGTFGADDVITTAPILDTLDIEDSDGVTFTLTTGLTSFAINGTGTSDVTLNNDVITGLNLGAENVTLEVNTLVADDVTIQGDIDGITLNGANVTGVTLTTGTLDSTTLETPLLTSLDFNDITGTSITMVNSPLIDTVSYVDTSIGTSTFASDQATLTISRIHPTSDGRENDVNTINFDALNSNDYTINAVNTNVNVTTDQASIAAFVVANGFGLTATNMTDITFDNSTVLSSIVLDNNDDLHTVDLGTASTTQLDIISDVTAITVSAVNSANVTVDGDFFTDVDVNAGSNVVAVDTAKTSSMTFDVQAGIFNINGDLTNITLDDTSVINNLIMNTDDLAIFNGGNADIESLIINDSALSLTVTANDVATLGVNSNDYDTLNVNVPIATDFNTSNNINNPGVEITTTTQTANVQLDNAIVTLYGANLDTVEVTANQFTFAGTKATLDLAINMDVGTATFNTANIDNLTIDDASVVTNLILDGVNMSSFTIGTADITNLDITTGAAAYSVDGAIDNIDFDAVNMNSVTIANAPTSTVTVTSSAATMDVNGTFDTFDIVNHSLTSIDVTTATLNELSIESDSLASLNTFTNVSETLILDSDINNFSLTTEADAVNFISVASNTLLFSSSKVGNINLTANVESVNVTGPSTTFGLFTPDLLSLQGTVSEMYVYSVNTASTLLVDMDASLFQFRDSGSVATLSFTGARTINDLIVSGAVATSINTGNIVDTSITLNGSLEDYILNTDLNTVDVNGTNDVVVNFNNLPTATVSGNTVSLEVNGVTDTVIANVLNNVTANFDNDADVTVQGTMSDLTVDGVTDAVDLSITGNATINYLDSAVVNVTGSAASTQVNGITDQVNLNITGLVTLIYENVADVEVLGTASDVTVTGITGTINFTVTGDIDLDFVNTGNVTAIGTASTIDIVNVTNVVNLTVSDPTTIDYGVSASGEIAGSADVLEVIGNSLANLTTSSLSGVTDYTMDGTSITTLDFMDNGLYSTLTTITMDSLVIGSVGDVIGYLDGTGITLNSPITDQDVFDYFKAEEVAALEAQEAIDSVRYDGFRATAVADELAIFRTNTDFDFLLDADLLEDINTHIDTDGATTYDLQEYMDAKAVDLGYVDEAAWRLDVGDGPVDTIEASMTATIASMTSGIEATLQAQVAASIDTDATNTATTNATNKGWTVG